jgi:preprotein translocase subunit SecG
MQTVIIILHIVVCVTLIGIVLLQTGRGAEMGAAFGGSNQTLFGASSGTTFMGKLTTVAAVLFMLTCIGLATLSRGPEAESLMGDVPEQTGPALPEAKPVQPGADQPGKAAPSERQGVPEQGGSGQPALPEAKPVKPSQGQGSAGGGSAAGEGLGEAQPAPVTTEGSTTPAGEGPAAGQEPAAPEGAVEGAVSEAQPAPVTTRGSPTAGEAPAAGEEPKAPEGSMEGAASETTPAPVTTE